MITSSLIGDSLILIGSIKYRAFSLHKIIVTFIQHMAVCDLAKTLGDVIPNMISSVHKAGGHSKLLIYLRFFITFYTSTVSSLLICGLALAKLLLLNYPFKVGYMTKRQAHKVCLGIWAASVYIPAIHLSINKDDVIFDHRNYNFMYRYVDTLQLSKIGFDSHSKIRRVLGFRQTGSCKEA